VLGSLRARVLVWVSLLLVVIFALTTVGLDSTFRSLNQSALDDLLEAELLGLISVAQPAPETGLSLPDDLAEPRFNLAGSGLYGAMWDAQGTLIWRSWSLLDRELDFGDTPQAVGQTKVVLVTGPSGDEIKAALMSINWEFANGSVRPFTFGVAVSMTPYLQQQRNFRLMLIGWFAIATVITLAVLAGLLHWVLAPLRRLENEVEEIEQGARTQLSTGLPEELAGLAANLDALVDSERRRQTRYRNTLDNLAHSLKTPLAVMGSVLAEDPDTPSHSALSKELGRMQERVSYHLDQARVGGGGFTLRAVDLEPVAQDLKESLDKVYQDKRTRCDVQVPKPCMVQVDPGDLMELLGNLLDNAYKYGDRQVQLRCNLSPEAVEIILDDDGAGWPKGHVAQLTQRGHRADQVQPGQGIGLAVVQELVGLYKGELTFSESSLGGGRVSVRLPQRRT
jgi:two-component system sensor histidine kinase PhoQ